MIYTNIQPPRKPTVFGKTSIRISFNRHITEFSEKNISVVGNTQGVSYTLKNTDKSSILNFKFPENSNGTITINLTGQVRKTDTDTLETIEKVSTTFSYDTQKHIDVSFGDVITTSTEFRIPVTFPEQILSLSKKNFVITASSKIRYFLYGSRNNFTLAIRKPKIKGNITIDIKNLPITKSNGIKVTPTSTTKTIEY